MSPREEFLWPERWYDGPSAAMVRARGMRLLALALAVAVALLQAGPVHAPSTEVVRVSPAVGSSAGGTVVAVRCVGLSHRSSFP